MWLGRETIRELYVMRAGRREVKRTEEGGIVEDIEPLLALGGAIEGGGGV